MRHHQHNLPDLHRTHVRLTKLRVLLAQSACNCFVILTGGSASGTYLCACHCQQAVPGCMAFSAELDYELHAANAPTALMRTPWQKQVSATPCNNYAWPDFASNSESTSTHSGFK